MKISYFDVDNLAYEGVKSGATIGNINILESFYMKGIDAKIYEVFNETDSNKDRNSLKVNDYENIRDIPVEKLPFELQEIKTVVEKERNDIILFSLPSVFFGDRDFELLDLLYKNCKKMIIVIADNLYPKAEDINNEAIRQKYISILQKSSIIVLSGYLKTKIDLEFCVDSNLLYPNINIDNLPEYKLEEKNKITFINPVPVKGITLFEKIVEQNPDLDFLIVRGWEETKNYKFNKPNVEIMDFQTDMKNVWKRTKIFVMLSIWNEIYGRVVSEAILNYSKVIYNNVGGIPEAAMNKGIAIEPLHNYGEEIYPKFDNIELEEKAKEIGKILKKELVDINYDALKQDREDMIYFIKNNNNELDKYSEKIIKMCGEG